MAEDKERVGRKLEGSSGGFMVTVRCCNAVCDLEE